MLFTLLIVFALIVVITLLDDGASKPSDALIVTAAMMIVVLQYLHVVQGGLCARRAKLASEKYKDADNKISREAGGGGDAEVDERLVRKGLGLGLIDDGAHLSDERFRGSENLSSLPKGMTMYTSCLSAQSYPDSGGKLWNNLVPPDERAVQSVQQDEEGTDGTEGTTCSAKSAASIIRSRRFHFTRTPTFSRRDGFVLGPNTLVGPYSFKLGIRGDMAFTIFVVCQFTGDIDGSPATLFKLFANTRGNNGISMVIEEGSSRGDKRAMRMSVAIGDGTKVPCKPKGQKDAVLVDANKKYMFVVVKNYNRVRVDMYNVHESEDARVPLAEANLGANEPLLFSNKDMVINEGANWNANIQAFGVYDRALTPRDASLLHDHFYEMYKELDTTYLQLAEQIEKLAKRRACPFGEATCGVCKGVDDWTEIENVYAASDECKKAIAAFCSDHPTHERCKCWNVNHPAYDKQCKIHRCSMNGYSTAECQEYTKRGNDPEEKESKMSTDEVRELLAAVVKQEQDRAAAAKEAEKAAAEEKEKQERARGGRHDDDKLRAMGTRATEEAANYHGESRDVDDEYPSEDTDNKPFWKRMLGL